LRRFGPFRLGELDAIVLGFLLKLCESGWVGRQLKRIWAAKELEEKVEVAAVAVDKVRTIVFVGFNASLATQSSDGVRK